MQTVTPAKINVTRNAKATETMAHDGVVYKPMVPAAVPKQETYTGHLTVVSDGPKQSMTSRKPTTKRLMTPRKKNQPMEEDNDDM
jgi:hypothetical protein